MSTDVAGTWATRIVIPIAIIISLRIIKKELHNRKHVKIEQRLIEDSFQKWLNYSSINNHDLTHHAIYGNLVNKIPVICRYSYPIIVTFWCLAQCTFIIVSSYQITIKFLKQANS